MNNIIRFWNQNRRKIIVGIIAIVLLIVLVQIMNELARQQKEKRLSQQNQEKIDNNLPTQSIITGEKVNVETTQSNTEIINKFVEYCNKGNTKEAYQLLTKQCKELIYPTENDFISNYYSLIFTEYRLCQIENFKNSANTYTYEIKFYNDALSQGKISESGIYTDYITIDTKSEDGKLNINGLIKCKDINKTLEQDGIAITVLQQQIYKDYEKYNIKIENKTEKDILLDTRKKTRTVYLIGDNNATYSAYMNQIPTNLLQINKKISRTYTVQFNKIYDPTILTTAIRFTDIVADVEKYQTTPDKIKERINIKIDI